MSDRTAPAATVGVDAEERGRFVGACGPLGREQVGEDLGPGGAFDLGERPATVVGVVAVELDQPDRVHEQRVEVRELLVAGGARDRPRRRESLPGAEDLLDEDGDAGRRGQAVEVPGRVTQPVDVVDPERVDHAGPHQPDDRRMGAREDLGVLDPHAHEAVDVEEPAHVAPRVSPVGELVVLCGHELGHR